MSPRAACRLESLGFRQVYDYVAGKADWSAFGLPREGRDASIPRVGDVARRDVPTCGLTDIVGAVRDRVRSAGWNTCLAVSENRVVLGWLRATEFDSTPATVTAEQVMVAGPSTVRPDARVEDTAGRMRDKHVANMVVSTPDGRLVGLFRLQDVESGSDASE